MKLSLLNFARSSVLGFGLLLALSTFATAVETGSSTATGGVDVTKFNIAGYRLYMTVEDALEVSPSLQIETIKIKGDLIGYKAKEGPITIFFTADELGKQIFRIERLTIFPTKPNVQEIVTGLIKRYGKPDAMGRVMLHSQACWGTCIGQATKLFLKIRIVQLTNKPFPVTLQLIDQKIEIANKKAFLKRTGR